MVEWDKVVSKGDFWTPEKIGDELVGKLVERTEGQYGLQFTIQTSDGKSIKLPSHKVLQARLSELALGIMVRIVFTGTQLPTIIGINPTSLYDVFVAKQ